MFGTGTPYYGKEGLWFLGGADNSPAMGDAYSGAYSSIAWAGVPLNAKFFFQLVFAGTAATIVSGAVAERIKYLSFIVFSAFMAIAIYPVVGHWIWGGGWLGSRRLPGFRRFDAGALDRRLGRPGRRLYAWPAHRQVRCRWQARAIPGHNMTAATIGCLILWLGWFGFNPGSTMAVMPEAISHICVTTNTAAAVRHAHGDRHLLDHAGQAGHRHDAQRLPGRPGGHHRFVCVRERPVVGHHRRDRRRAGRVLRDVL